MSQTIIFFFTKKSKLGGNVKNDPNVSTSLVPGWGRVGSGGVEEKEKEGWRRRRGGGGRGRGRGGIISTSAGHFVSQTDRRSEEEEVDDDKDDKDDFEGEMGGGGVMEEA